MGMDRYEIIRVFCRNIIRENSFIICDINRIFVNIFYNNIV